MGDEDDISLEREKKAISKDLVNSYIEHSKTLVQNSSRLKSGSLGIFVT